MRDDTGHRTATIPRPTGPARLAREDREALADEVAPSRRRRGPKKRARVLVAILAAVVAGSLGAAVMILPIKAWLNQREELANREADLDRLNAQNADLYDDIQRLRTKDGVIDAARDELGAVKDDEKVYRVLSDPSLSGVLPEGWLYPTIGSLIEARTLGVNPTTATSVPTVVDPATETSGG